MINQNHPLNNHSILLSKSNGFFKTLQFRELPNDVLTLERIQPLSLVTQDQMFDFNVGDEFEYHAWSPGSPGCYFYYNILNKSIMGNTVKYKRFVKSKCYEFFWTPTPHLDSTIISYQDSVYYSYLNTPFYSTLPEENTYTDSFSIFNYIINTDSSYYNNRYVYSTTTGFIGYSQTDSCFALNNFEPSVYIVNYSPELGEVYWESNQTASQGSRSIRELIWYRKGAETWGTYNDIVTENREIYKVAVNVFPNPVSDLCQVQMPEIYKGSFLLKDITGKILKNIPFEGKFLNLNLEGLANGIYFLSFEGSPHSCNKKIIKQ